MSLRSRLLERIRNEGPITFADYMEAALYDPEEGFFSRAPVGRDFVTSVHLSPVFALLLARQVSEAATILGEPPAVLDLGAGDGLLGRQLREAIPGLRYVAVERSARARADLTAAGVETFATLKEVGAFTGVVIANELFDNLPFHLLRGDREVLVAANGDDLIEEEAAPTVTAGDGRHEERPVLGEQTRQLVSDIAGVLNRGYVLVLDYGFVDGEPVEPIRGYAANRMVEDLLARPGETDITGPVDFAALATLARAAGLEVFGPVTQREALMALGYRGVLDQMRADQKAAEERGDWRTAIAGFSARGDASMLVDLSGLGALKVLVLATPGLPNPAMIPVA